MTDYIRSNILLPHFEVAEAFLTALAGQDAQFTFQTFDDVEVWSVKNGIAPDAIPPYGLFVDPILLYYWVYTRLIGGGTSQ